MKLHWPGLLATVALVSTVACAGSSPKNEISARPFDSKTSSTTALPDVSTDEIGRFQSSRILSPSVDDLVARSEAVVVAQAQASRPVLLPYSTSRGPKDGVTPPKYLLATDWTIKVSSVIKSPANLSPASTLQVRLQGGIYKDLNFHPDDSPPFEVGGTYLLFLSVNPDDPARTLWNAPEFESMVLIGSSLEAPTIGPGQT